MPNRCRRAIGSASRRPAPDDLGVGVALEIESPPGALAPTPLDVRDLFHFDVEERADVRLYLTGGLLFVLLRDDGARIGEFARFRRQLAPGGYVVAVSTSSAAPACGTRSRC